MSDNHFMDFPAIMQDGRLFTDYKSSCVMNALSQGMTSFEYRNFLTQNGQQILQNNTKLVNEIAGCKQCGGYSVVPPFVAVTCDQDQCIQSVKSPMGVGAEIQGMLDKTNQMKIEYVKNQVAQSQ